MNIICKSFILHEKKKCYKMRISIKFIFCFECSTHFYDIFVMLICIIRFLIIFLNKIIAGSHIVEIAFVRIMSQVRICWHVSIIQIVRA